jgi:perosamine synthetase
MIVTDRRPAIEGGRPIRERPLPYGRQAITDADVAAVSAVLRGDWLTTGPAVGEFEQGLADVTGAADVVAVSSGTAALHAACATLDLQSGDEVILPSLTFAASANAVLYVGGTPVFAEIDPTTFLLDPADVARRVTPRTRAIMVVHYAGLPADPQPLGELARGHGLAVIEDAAHALGARQAGGPVGAASELATFSFHPVKHVTTAEGGAIVTSSTKHAERLRRFRNHGLSSDVRTREAQNTWQYDLVELGFNYRLSDVGAALGISQLSRLPANLARRRALARLYRESLADVSELQPQRVADIDAHAWHLFPVLLRDGALRIDRDGLVRALRAELIGANVHYAPVHLLTLYRQRLHTSAGMLPVTEDVCARILTLPMFPAMTDDDHASVIRALRRIVDWYRT